MNKAPKYIVEAKNVGTLGYTQQLQNYVALAQDLNYTLVVAVRTGDRTTLLPALEAARDRGDIVIWQVIK